MLRRDPSLKMEKITTGFISKGYLHRFQQDKEYPLAEITVCTGLVMLTILGVFPNMWFSLTILKFKEYI